MSLHFHAMSVPVYVSVSACVPCVCMCVCCHCVTLGPNCCTDCLLILPVHFTSSSVAICLCTYFSSFATKTDLCEWTEARPFPIAHCPCPFDPAGGNEGFCGIGCGCGCVPVPFGSRMMLICQLERRNLFPNSSTSL